MNRDKAEVITQIMNKIKSCENYLSSLKDRSYADEFSIYYRGGETCDLEPEALKLLVSHYENKLVNLKKELEKY